MQSISQFIRLTEYRPCIGKDKTNALTYGDVETILARYCGAKDEVIITDKTRVVESLRKYHCPIAVKANDMLDGHLVKYVSESVDIRGNTQFWVVKTEI